MNVEAMETATQTASAKVHTSGHTNVVSKAVTKPQYIPVESANGKKTGADVSSGSDERKSKEISESTVREAVSSANRKMTSSRCEFSYHEGTNRVSIKVIDKDSDEIIREIPPEKSLDMLQKLWEAAGLFVDEQK